MKRESMFKQTRTAVVWAGAVLLMASCDAGSTVSGPLLKSVSLSLADSVLVAGDVSSATGTALDRSGRPVTFAYVTYTSSDPVIAAVDPNTGAIFAIHPGSVHIVAAVGATMAERSLTVLPAPFVLNEIKPNGAALTGWVELYNTTQNDLDISGWSLSGSDVFQRFTLPAGTRIVAGGYRVINEIEFPVGLESADAVHLFSPHGVLVETYRWLQEPALSYGRCPDGFGSFASSTAITRGGANICAEPGP
jgi:hypothetical protein